MMDKLCILYFGTSCFVTFVLQFGLHNIYFFPLTKNAPHAPQKNLAAAPPYFFFDISFKNTLRFLKKTEKFFKNCIDKTLKNPYTGDRKKDRLVFKIRSVKYEDCFD